jgi:DNA-binding transcriptional ArsR family regulator
MIDTATTPSKIRDLTAVDRRIPIEVDGAAIYETLLAMWTAFNPEESNSGFDLGPKWISDLKEATPADLVAEIAAIGGPYCSLILPLLGLVATAPRPHDQERVLKWLASLDPQRLRRWILGYIDHHSNPGLIEEAAEGDLEAVRQIVAAGKGATLDEEQVHQVVAIFDIPGEELRDRIVSAVTRFRAEVFSAYEEPFAAAISRAAAAQRATSVRDSVKGLIEQVTNGLDYEIPLGVTRVVLVPSVVLKPLSLIDQHRETLMVFYGMADEFIDSDPEAPPSWLVKTYKALSDERRLRILRRLSEGETTLDELTDLLGLSKSTVHHHMSVLRAAGLVRVHLSHSKDEYEKSKTYALRQQALDSAGTFLDAYMRTEPAPPIRSREGSN